MYSYEWRKFLSNEQKAEVKDTFQIFGESNENKLSFSDLNPALMALGFDLAQDEIERLINNFKKNFPDTNYLTLENFLDLVGMRLVRH